MAKWTCRFVKPAADVMPREIEAASDAEAALEYHSENDKVGYRYRHELPDSGVQFIYFARVGVVGDGGAEVTMVTRIYHHGLFRKGGVKVRTGADTLAEIARLLDWDDDPEALVAEGWELEETMQQAQERRDRQWSKKA